MTRKAKMEFEVIDLEPMRVASYRYVGEHPEDGAYDGLFKWIAQKNLLATERQPRFFGFNNPSPTEGDPVYGFEVWVTVGNDVESDDVITVKDMPGGVHAAVKAEGIDSGWEFVHERLGPWTEENGYQYDGKRQWLEEHFPDSGDLSEAARIGREPRWIGFGVCLPIKLAGE